MNNRFERPQYIEVYKMWEDAESKHKTPCDTYGAEHLCRLLGKPAYPMLIFLITI